MISLIVILAVLFIVGYLVQQLMTGPRALKNTFIFILCLIALLYTLYTFGIVDGPEFRHR